MLHIAARGVPLFFLSLSAAGILQAAGNGSSFSDGGWPDLGVCASERARVLLCARSCRVLHGRGLRCFFFSFLITVNDDFNEFFRGYFRVFSLRFLWRLMVAREK